MNYYNYFHWYFFWSLYWVTASKRTITSTDLMCISQFKISGAKASLRFTFRKGLALNPFCFHLNFFSQVGWHRYYRAFSCDVMPSSNMAASITTEINIHLCKHLSILLCVTVSPWTSLGFVVQAVHDDRVRAWCMWLPWISRSVCAIQYGHVGGQRDVSENALFWEYLALVKGSVTTQLWKQKW